MRAIVRVRSTASLTSRYAFAHYFVARYRSCNVSCFSGIPHGPFKPNPPFQPLFMKKTLMITAFAATCLALSFCSKKDGAVSGTDASSPNLPATTFAYAISYPAHVQSALSDSDNTPLDNPLTNDGATLGRVLFYDKHLSKNDKISCGGCHRQAFGFDDTARLSRGFEDSLTARNSMSLLNLRFYKSGRMFWDERAASIEKQALVPIQNHLEMGLTLAELEARVKAQFFSASRTVPLPPSINPNGPP